MEAHLRAGLAIFNAGEHHAAHDAWEEYWLDLTSGTDDERLLHGLIQYTAAVYHARNDNWSGARGLAESAREYLADLPATYHGVDVAAVREYLADLRTDPAIAADEPPLSLTHKGKIVTLADLDFEATCTAAAVLAEEHEYDETMVDRAITFARADIDAERTGSPFVTLLFDFVREPDDRPVIAQRLSEHVSRRTSKEADVEGLFERREE
jgi:hypothetical protein